MMRKICLWLCAIAVLPLVVPVHLAGQHVSVVEAARQGNVATLRTLLKDGADVNGAEGDGMTPLHWAAQGDNVELANVLIAAGANLRATTRVGGYTPLLVASRNGNAAMVKALISGGADPNLANTNGTTPLMFAAGAGNSEAVKALLTQGADVNAREAVEGQTALMFAAAYGRADAVRLLTAHGADPNIQARIIDLDPFLKREAASRNNGARKGQAPKKSPDVKLGPDVRDEPKAGFGRKYTFTELVGGWGGLSPLHLAARQGELDTVKALLDAGAQMNQRSTGNDTTPLLIATLNGQFDLAKYLLDHGADPTLAQDNGVTPLFAVLNVQWAGKAFYPQPRAFQQQKTSYLDLMAALLDKGADVNARTTKKVWTSGYNTDRSASDDGGATPFWRAAYASDIEAMKLLVARGADPNVPSMRPFGQIRANDDDGGTFTDISGLGPVPVGGPGVPPLLASAGLGYAEGYAGNIHRFAPTGILAAARYFVEELHMDVNATDHEGNTALHNAAARGDNEMILYLISKGADPKVVNRYGQTTLDMANGPVQRTLPYPDTIKLLEGLGVKNNHRCASC